MESVFKLANRTQDQTSPAQIGVPHPPASNGTPQLDHHLFASTRELARR
ncbi:Uncharacterised protein [Mycobacteroides abscessus subsp. abscessus]|nr:Uncharacterised protein [Mycobacteroides abscessus subsp. bolletii]SKU76884.1 Uncharacterised protein [Mycobacteroides abscessus subsp. abscessus]SHS07965.1 Uncharacterised protein [Mycobacteroides abscessus subsp. bolletii]SHS95746.1 Uncharacterised protein [Mycobacteroides abscessus subsp. bolletii]SKF66697.1 Uncharacterised protein [Mycobacteroides abscessus subsp. bolletii]